MSRSQFLLVPMLLLASACAPREAALAPRADEPDISDPTETPAIRPIGDAKNWMLVEPLLWRVGETGEAIIVPRGFVTDFASIPPLLQSFIRPLGPHLRPAIVHDYLYWTQTCSRSQADRLFRIAMKEAGVSTATRTAMYQAVHRFGSRAWARNARERAEGQPRVVPGAGVREPKSMEDWAAYREYLYDAGVRPGPPSPISAAFCAHGDSP